MYLTQKQTVKPNNSLFKELDYLCYLSKNLYNSTLYVARKSFFDKKYRNYYSINKEFTDKKHPDYLVLPAKVAKQTQLLVDKSFKSYFSLVKKKKTDNYNKPIRLSRYLDKDKGRQVVIYPKDALSFKRDGYINLSKTNIFIKSDIAKDKVKNVRLIPLSNHIEIEIVYKVDKKNFIDTGNYAAIDLGIDNLATVCSTEGIKKLELIILYTKQQGI